MATINLATKLGASQAQSPMGTRIPISYHEAFIDFASAVTAKGSALAAADVIQAINIPPESVVLAAGLDVITAVAGGVSVLTVGLGTTVSASIYVTAYDLFAATANQYAPMNSAAYPTVYATASTVDLTISSLTGVLATGKVRVWALIGDLLDTRKPLLAALKS